MKEQQGNNDVRKIVTILRDSIHIKVSKLINSGLNDEEARQTIAKNCNYQNWNSLMSKLGQSIKTGSINFATLIKISDVIEFTPIENLKKEVTK